jgi:catechol 2,3-dioxygenase-like lactoylglutathione lyase family enzyme
MIIGAHAIVYSKDADADRAFLKDVLGFPYVDAGEAWLIFRLPPAEVAVHPSEENDVHELYLMTDDVEALVATLKARGIEATGPTQRGWGLLTEVTLPGGGRLGIYQPRHASPPGDVSRKRTRARKSASTRKKPARPRR